MTQDTIYVFKKDGKYLHRNLESLTEDMLSAYTCFELTNAIMMQKVCSLEEYEVMKVTLTNYK